MNLRRELRTDRWLWLLFTVAAFVSFGFVHLHAEAVEQKIGPSHFWGVLQTVTRHWDHPDALGIAAICFLVVAVPAAIAGWVCQAVVVVIREAARSHGSGPTSPPRDTSNRIVGREYLTRRDRKRTRRRPTNRRPPRTGRR
jgi:hypothetical protein